MKIDIDLNEMYPNASLEITDFDIDKMWDILQSDRWWFEEYIMSYLIDNISNIENEERTIELMNELNAKYANA